MYVYVCVQFNNSCLSCYVHLYQINSTNVVKIIKSVKKYRKYNFLYLDKKTYCFSSLIGA